MSKYERERTPSSPAVITGTAFSQTPFARRKDVNFPGVFVTFAAQARTFWHSHPAGQTLIITAGCGILQSQGSDPLVVRPGHVVWIPPGVKHWHGGSAATSMSHYAMVTMVNGKAIEVMEAVSAAQYELAAVDAACPARP